MPKSLNSHPAERVDLVDFVHGTVTFPREIQDLHREIPLLDNQARYVRGFQVEIPDQTIYPGRIVVHAGAAIDPTGRLLFNDNQRNVSRTVTLEGASQSFYVEIEFTEAESDVDDRAFWDPTVDQGSDPSGDPRPDGQEYSNNVSTRNTPDWQVVTPIRVGSGIGFERDTSPNSTKVPLIFLATDSNNQIAAWPTTAPRTTLLEIIATTPGQIRVQDATHFGTGDVELGVGYTLGSPRETLTVSSVDYDAGTITFTGNIVNSHTPGEIIQRVDAGAPNLDSSGLIPRYTQILLSVGADARDSMFRGDEDHGAILLEGHANPPGDRDDISLQSLKDHIDLLSAKLQEMQWGWPGYTPPAPSGAVNGGDPPGIQSTFPSPLRYFSQAGGIQPTRTYTYTIGDQFWSVGDYNTADETGFNDLISAMATATGTDEKVIYVKRGTYTLANDIVIDRGMTLVFDPESQVINDGGGFDIQTTDRVVIRGLRMSRSGGTPTNRGLYFNTSNPASLELTDIEISDLTVEVADCALPYDTLVDRLVVTGSSGLAALPLVYVSNASGKIRGVWKNCFLDHTAPQAALDGSCIRATVPTNGIEDAKFVDCRFVDDATLAPASQISLGGSRRVVFSRCESSSGATSHTNSKVIGTSNVDLQFLNCRQTDTADRFMSFTGVDGLLVDGFVNDATSSVSQIRLISFTNAIITNSRFQSSSSTTVTTSPIFLDSASGWSKNLTVSNNTFNAASDLVTGLIFDNTAGSGFDKISVINNDFVECEVGIFIQASLGSGDMKNCTVRDNKFVDEGSSTTQANYQRACILTDSFMECTFWSIIDNYFINVNPADTNTVAGLTTRCAIRFRNSGAVQCRDIKISGNHIRRVGDSANAVANTSAIRIDNPQYCSVVHNYIEDVDGTDAFGILFGAATFTATRCMASNNTIEAFTATTGNCYPIVFTSVADSVISDNSINTFTSASGEGIGIKVDGGVTGTCDNLTITGNKIDGNTGGTTPDMIALVGDTIRKITISGNFGDGCDKGIYFDSHATGVIDTIAVTGNTVISNDRNIDYNYQNNCPLANVQRITLSGNTCRCSDADSTNIVMSAGSLISCTGNTCENLGTHTVAQGQNIFVSVTAKFSIIGNVCRMQNNANSVSIEISSGADIFVVQGNLLDQGTGALGTSILTYAGTGPTANGNYIAGNVVDVGTVGIPATIYGASTAAQSAGAWPGISHVIGAY
jgi:hypothetical protein